MGVDDLFIFPTVLSDGLGPCLSLDNHRKWVDATLGWIEGAFPKDGYFHTIADPGYTEGELIPPKINLWMSFSAFRKSKLYSRKEEIFPRFLRMYGEALTDLGLAPPPVPKKPTCEQIERFFQTVLDPSFDKSLNWDLAKNATMPKSSRDDVGSSDPESRERMAIALAMEEADLFDELDFMVRATEMEHERLKRQLIQSKMALADTKRTLSALQGEMECIIEIWPASHLTRVHGAERVGLGSEGLAGLSLRLDSPEVYRLPNGDFYETDLFEWRDVACGVHGLGVLELEWHMCGLSFDQSIARLLGEYSVQTVHGSV
jgi:hypothetical protein